MEPKGFFGKPNGPCFHTHFLSTLSFLPSFRDCMPQKKQTDSALNFGAMEKDLLAWFERNMRPLPWRRHYSPYGVWISEIMLQQTQMERGVSYYLAWMERFPDLASLARAPEEEVLKAWEGLGYYSRARNILKAARTIMERHNGVFPSKLEDIRALPGIGPYTAAAIASIAFCEDVACIDANVERVVARLADLDLCVREKDGKEALARLANAFLQKGCGRLHNQAMMELGALVCGKNPDCRVCPLQKYCLSLQRNTVTLRPVLPARQERIPITVASGVLLHNSRIYVQKRLPKDVWGGLWEFPGGGIEEGERPAETVVREFFEETGFRVRILAKLATIKHAYTKYHVTLHCFALELASEPESSPCDCDFPAPPRLSEASDYRWLTLKELEGYAMPSAHRKLANSLHIVDGTLQTRPKANLPQLPLD